MIELMNVNHDLVVNRSSGHQEIGFGMLNARYNFSKMESKVYYALSGMLDDVAYTTGVLVVQGKDIIKSSGIRRQLGCSTKKYLYRTIEKLMDKYIFLHDSQDNFGTKVIESAKLYANDIWELKLGKWISSIGNKTRGFVPVEMENVRKWPTKYAERLFNLIHGAPNGKYTLWFPDIRKKFQLPHSYDNAYNLIARVIEPAVDAINSSGLLKVSYKRIRNTKPNANGKICFYYTGIEFDVEDEERAKRKAELAAQIEKANAQVAMMSSQYTSENQIAYLNKRGINLLEVLKLVKRFNTSLENILSLLVVTENRVIKKSPIDYIAGMLKKEATASNILVRYTAHSVDATNCKYFRATTELDCRYAITICEVIASMTDDSKEKSEYRSKAAYYNSVMGEITGKLHKYYEPHNYKY